jgi:hypothetical protein
VHGGREHAGGVTPSGGHTPRFYGVGLGGSFDQQAGDLRPGLTADPFAQLFDFPACLCQDLRGRFPGRLYLPPGLRLGRDNHLNDFLHTAYPITQAS